MEHTIKHVALAPFCNKILDLSVRLHRWPPSKLNLYAMQKLHGLMQKLCAHTSCTLEVLIRFPGIAGIISTTSNAHKNMPYLPGSMLSLDIEVSIVRTTAGTAATA